MVTYGLVSGITISNTGGLVSVLTTSSLSSGVWLLTYQASLYSASTFTISNFQTFLANSPTSATTIVTDNNGNSLTNIGKVTSGTQTLTGFNVVAQQSASCIVTLTSSTTISLWFNVTANNAVKASGNDTSAGQQTYIQTMRIG